MKSFRDMRSLVLLVTLFACSSPANTERTPPTKAPVAEPRIADSRPRPLPTLDEVRARVARDCPKVAAPYFFKVEKAGKVGHILGTRHISVALTKFPKVVHDTLDGAARLVFETDPDDPDVAPPPPKASLPQQLGPDLWAQFETLVGTDRAQLIEGESPATAFVTMLVINEDLGARLDEEIISFARRERIPADGLETHEFQAKLLDKLLDLRMLKATIATSSRAQLESEASSELRQYCAGTDSTPGLDKVARDGLRKSGYSDAELDAIDEMVVFERNRNWIPKLEQMFQVPNMVIVVGAGHLIGNQGVPAMLAARGFKVTRVTPPN